MQIDVDYTAGGWKVACGALTLEATGSIRDRGTIRCTLSVWNGGRVVHRDNVNLTGDRARARFIAKVQAKGVSIAEDHLLALDEAIRTSPRPTPNGHEKTIYDTPSDISCKVGTVSELAERVNKWLKLKDTRVLNILLGAVVAHRLGGESPWLLIVAPPSGAKTELIRMLSTSPDVYPLSELTARTFASGLDTHGDDPSLLARLRDEILMLKDLTTVLEMQREERQAVLAQLREIYDGRFDKAWGTGKELHWEGRLGFLAGVTPIIDQHHTVMGLLGPRFLLTRQPELGAQLRVDVAKRAMENANQESAMRAELAGATKSFLAGIGRTPPAVPAGAVDWLARVANLVTCARSPVNRDGFKRELQYAPEPEIPARLARQLHALLQGLTLVSGHATVAPTDLGLIASVAWDCVPVMRQRMLAALGQADEMLSTSQIAGGSRIPTTTARYALEDLQALGLVQCEKGGQGSADHWALDDSYREALDILQQPPADLETYHEMSEPRHTEYLEDGMRDAEPEACAVCGAAVYCYDEQGRPYCEQHLGRVG